MGLVLYNEETKLPSMYISLYTEDFINFSQNYEKKKNRNYYFLDKNKVKENLNDITHINNKDLIERSLLSCSFTFTFNHSPLSTIGAGNFYFNNVFFKDSKTGRKSRYLSSYWDNNENKIIHHIHPRLYFKLQHKYKDDYYLSKYKTHSEIYKKQISRYK